MRYVHRDLKDYNGRGAQDGHLDFYTSSELRNIDIFFSVALRPKKP